MNRLISPENIAKLTREQGIQAVIADLKSRQKKKPIPPLVGYQYREFQQKVTLLRGIADIEPYELTLPDPPPIHEFVNYGLEPKDQVFQRVKFPKKLEEICRAVRTGVRDGEKYTRDMALSETLKSNELCDFIEGLWLKRLTGDWQLINGIPLHISPSYFFYLNFWEMNIGLPDFRCDFYHYCSDLWHLAAWDYIVVPHHFCDGMINFTLRQTGKSFLTGMLMYEKPSRTYECNAGMQSKTDADAALLFEKCVVKPWRKLPFFFAPVCSNSTYPKKALNFTPRAKRGKEEAIESLDNDELMGYVDFSSSTIDAYDGATLDLYGSDECGKTVEVNVYERYLTIRPALRTRRGKSYHTTTVEEIVKRGGFNFKKMWDKSNRNPHPAGDREVMVDIETGETKTGLFPWFMPAYCSYTWNRFGFALVDRITTEEQQYAQEKGIKYWKMCGIDAVNHIINSSGSQWEQQDNIRKHPRNIREAFESSITNCKFDLEIINARLKHFAEGYTDHELEFMQFGIFEWEDEFGGNVKWCETDRDHARWHRIVLPGEENWKNHRRPLPGNKFEPGNTHLFCSSSDTFKYNTKDLKNPDKSSWGTGHVFAYDNPMIDPIGTPHDRKLTDDFISEYKARPKTVEEYCQDMLMESIYMGCKRYAEYNLDNVGQYFQKHNCEAYLQVGRKLILKNEVTVYKDEVRAGSFMAPGTIESIFRVLGYYVVRSGKHCKFYRTLRDLKEVDDDFSPYDLATSAGHCLIAVYDINTPKLAKQKERESAVTHLSAKAMDFMINGGWN